MFGLKSNDSKKLQMIKFLKTLVLFVRIFNLHSIYIFFN